MSSDRHAENVAPWDGIIRYQCWVCSLRIEGKFAPTLRLMKIHQAEHNDG